MQGIGQREYHCEEAIDVRGVRSFCFDRSLIEHRKSNTDGGVFDSLQEEKSMDDYGNVLGRMVCIFIRMMDLESEFGEEHPWLRDGQRQMVQSMRERLIEEDMTAVELDELFHLVLKELFFWHESTRLMDCLDCPVQRFLVYASVDKGGQGFIHTREICRLLAKLMFGIRACIFKEFTMGMEEGREGMKFDKDLGGLLEYVTDLLQTPFGFLRETMHFAASVVGESGALPQVSWLGIEEGLALAIHGKRVELNQLRGLSKRLLKEAEIQLHNRVKMGLSVGKDLDWNSFEAEDDLTNIREGYSFLSSQGIAFKSEKSALLHAFMSNSITREFFTRGINGDVILWKKMRCMDWLKRTKRMLEMLVVLCHLLGGQPARATELATLRWRNGVDEQRGVYWANSTIMMLAMYTKTRSITGRNRLIPRYILRVETLADDRFMPKRLGVLLAEYLAIVRPLEVFLSEKFKCKGATDLNEFIWADYNKGLWTGEFISDLLKKTTSHHEMHGLGFREYRQVATAFMEKHLKYKAADPDDENVNAVFDMQAGHSSRTAGASYAVATEDHRQVSRDVMHRYYTVSREWYELLLEEEVIESKGQGVAGESEVAGVTGESAFTRERRITRESGVTRVTEKPGVMEMAREKVMDWSPLQSRSAWGMDIIERPPSVPMELARRKEDGVSRLRLSAEALHGLRGLYGDDKAQFKSEEQAEAVRLTLERKTDLLVILPTGGGKSVVFMAPAWMEMGLTTVVIVPFVALIEEMQERCNEQGIGCYIWRNNNVTLSQRMAQIVLVRVENAVTPEFRQFLIRLEQGERLGRIVIDECHVLLTQRDFRPVMRRVTSVVRCVCVPLVLLTATLPIGMELMLRLTMACESFRVVRKKSERRELCYKVMELGSEAKDRRDLDMAVWRVLQSKLREMGDEERVIIYCLQRKWAEELARFINDQAGWELSQSYHADMEFRDRQKVYADWRDGMIKCVVATSALSAGIDHAGVRLVIHHGHGKNMIDQCQEMGRAGRDGKRAECLTVYWDGIESETEWVKKDEREAVLRWIKGGECLRRVLGEYLDGSGLDCVSMAGAELCDRCEEMMEGLRVSGESLWGGRRMSQGSLFGWLQEAREVTLVGDLKDMVRELRGTCPVCFFAGREGYKMHTLNGCR